MMYRALRAAAAAVCASAALLAVAGSASAATVTLRVTPDRFDGFATYELEYFSVACEWSDGVADPDCTRAGAPEWTATQGWFESDRRGTINRTSMEVQPEGSRPKTARGKTVMWSTDFSTQVTLRGTVAVTYAGKSVRVPLKINKACQICLKPIPKGLFGDQPSAAPTVGGPSDLAAISQWSLNNDIDSPGYIAAKNKEAQETSDRLEAYIKEWYQGRADALIPEEVFPPNFADNGLRWKLVKPGEIDKNEVWFSRPSKPDTDPERDGVTTLFPDTNATYLRIDYPAPFESKLVLKGQFPHGRFFAFHNSAPYDPERPAGPSVGAPEVPIVDADMEPDVGSVNPYRVGADRNAPNRNYTVTFQHKMGEAVELNERVAPGSMTEDNDAPLRSMGSTNNTRVGSGFRSGGAIAAGRLLPAQLWVRIYEPDRNKGVFGGVELPDVHIELPTGEKFMIVPVRGPDPSGVARDNFIRRLNGPFPAKEFREQRSFEPKGAGPSSELGWKKTFGIFRSVAEDLAYGGYGILIPKPFHNAWKNTIRKIDKLGNGRGVNESGVGSFEQSATTASYIHYFGRPLVVGKGKVAVLTAKLPVTPRTRDGQSKMTAGELRYFSITRYLNGPKQSDLLNLMLPAGAFGTLADEDIVTKSSGDAKGWFAIAYSREEDRPSNATTANGVTWQNWTNRTQQQLVIRWLEVGPEWSSKWAPNRKNLPWKTNAWSEPTFDPKQTFRNTREGSFMKDNHITVHYMTKEQFERLGPNVNPKTIGYTTGW